MKGLLVGESGITEMDMGIDETRCGDEPDASITSSEASGRISLSILRMTPSAIRISAFRESCDAGSIRKLFFIIIT